MSKEGWRGMTSHGDKDPGKVAAPADSRSVDDEWRETIICMGMLIDRIDKLVIRSGAPNRMTLMRRLGSRR